MAQEVKLNFNIGKFLRDLNDPESPETRGGFRAKLSEVDFDQLIGVWDYIYKYVADGIKIDDEPDYDLIKDQMSLSLEIVGKYKDEAPRGAATSVTAEKEDDRSGSSFGSSFGEVEVEESDDDSDEEADPLPVSKAFVGKFGRRPVPGGGPGSSSSDSSGGSDGIVEYDGAPVTGAPVTGVPVTGAPARPVTSAEVSSSSEGSEDEVKDFLASDSDSSR